jgi:hypothetical protein
VCSCKCCSSQLPCRIPLDICVPQKLRKACSKPSNAAECNALSLPPSSQRRPLYQALVALGLLSTTEVVGRGASIEAQVGGLLVGALLAAALGVREQERADEQVCADDDDDADPSLRSHLLPGLDRVVDEAVLPLDDIGEERIEGDFFGHGCGVED